MTDRLRWFVVCLVVFCLPASAQQPKGTPFAGSAAGAKLLMRKAQARRFLADRRVAGRSGAAALMQARKQHAAMAQSGSTSLGQPWTAVGPAQVSTSQFGLVAGRVSSIAVDASDATGNTVYLGSAGGGVWKSTNAAGAGSAVSFAPLTDDLSAFSGGNLASLSIGAVSVQPGGTGVVLAGTGDPNDALDSYYGSGLLRSADGGVTWSLIQSTDDATFGGGDNFYFVGEAFSGFAWSTVNPQLVVAAVSDSAEGLLVDAPEYEPSAGVPASALGLYYSTDAGSTWRLATITDGPGQVLQSSAAVFESGGNAATSVAWNPARKRFYAAVRFHGYYDSPDGSTWTKLPNQPGGGFNSSICPANPGQTGSSGCPIFRGTLAVQPATGDMFALTADINNLDEGMWQDVCGLAAGACSSGTVSFATQLPSGALEAGGGDTTIPHADYNLSLAAVPAGGDTLLFAGTQDIYRCSLAAGCAWRNTTNTQTCAAAQVAPAQHAIDGSMAPSLLLIYFGNDSGLWRTTDDVGQAGQVCGSDDAAHFQNLNSGLGSLAEVKTFAQDPGNGGILLAGLGVNGTAASSVAAEQAWPQVLDGYGSYVAIDPVNPQNWYAESAGGVSIARCRQGAACNAAGFGTTPAIGTTQVGQEDAAAALLPLPFLLDPQDSTQAIVGTCRIWRGPADGSGWSSGNLLSTMLDGDQGPYCNGNAVVGSLAATGTVLGQPAATELIYAGMAGLLDGGGAIGGHLFSQAISGPATTPIAWTDISLSPVSNDAQGFNPQDFAISVTADAHDQTGQTIYAAVQGFSSTLFPTALLYSSIDAGAHWTNITSNLPDAPVNSVAIDPNDANTVYTALDTGVYVTTSITNCATQNCWSIYGAGLPNAPVTELAAFNSGRTAVLRAATYGRGIWQTPLVTASVTTTTATLSPVSLSFVGQPVQTASATQSITVTNTGTAALTVSQVSAGEDYSETDNCSAAVQPNAGCAIQVTFTPTQTGTRTGTLAVFANIAGGQLTASLSGTGLPGPAIVLLPTSMSFGQEPIGSVTSPAQNITISNTGGASVNLQTPQVSAGFLIAANTCSSSLPPNTGCTVSISFAPGASGAISGTFSITDDVGTQTATLSGTGFSPATDEISPQALSFAPQIVGSSSPAQPVTLNNSGDSPLTSIAIQTAGDFSAVNGCGETLIGHASCSVSVTYVPKNTGAESGSITVTDMYGKPQTVALSGSGLAPAGISALPASLDFGSWGQGAQSATQQITLTDNGGVPLNQLGFAITGDFSIAGNDCSTNLAAGSDCAVQVVFSPTAVGPRSGTLTITSPTLSKPFQISLGGTGVQFQLQVSGASSATVTSGQTAKYSLAVSPAPGTSGTIAFTCSGAPVNSTCEVNPASLQISSGVSGFLSVSVATGLAPASASIAQHREQGGRWPWLLLGVLFPCARLSRERFRRRPRRILRPKFKRMTWWLLAACAAFIFPIGCGVGASGGGSTGAPPSSAGSNPTPSGTYSLTITATGQGISATVPLTLVVE